MPLGGTGANVSEGYLSAGEDVYSAAPSHLSNLGGDGSDSDFRAPSTSSPVQRTPSRTELSTSADEATSVRRNNGNRSSAAWETPDSQLVAAAVAEAIDGLAIDDGDGASKQQRAGGESGRERWDSVDEGGGASEGSDSDFHGGMATAPPSRTVSKGSSEQDEANWQAAVQEALASVDSEFRGGVATAPPSRTVWNGQGEQDEANWQSGDQEALASVEGVSNLHESGTVNGGAGGHDGATQTRFASGVTPGTFEPQEFAPVVPTGKPVQPLELSIDVDVASQGHTHREAESSEANEAAGEHRGVREGSDAADNDDGGARDSPSMVAYLAKAVASAAKGSAQAVTKSREGWGQAASENSVSRFGQSASRTDAAADPSVATRLTRKELFISDDSDGDESAQRPSASQHTSPRHRLAGGRARSLRGRLLAGSDGEVHRPRLLEYEAHARPSADTFGGHTAHLGGQTEHPNPERVARERRRTLRRNARERYHERLRSGSFVGDESSPNGGGGSHSRTRRSRRAQSEPDFVASEPRYDFHPGELQARQASDSVLTAADSTALASMQAQANLRIQAQMQAQAQVQAAVQAQAQLRAQAQMQAQMQATAQAHAQAQMQAQMLQQMQQQQMMAGMVPTAGSFGAGSPIMSGMSSPTTLPMMAGGAFSGVAPSPLSMVGVPSPMAGMLQMEENMGVPSQQQQQQQSRMSEQDRRRGSRRQNSRSSDAEAESDLKLALSAVRHGRVEDVDKLLGSGLDANAANESGTTLLSVACQNGHKRIAKRLLRAGADINAGNHRGQTALHYSFAFGHFELSDYLISKGADDQAMNEYGLSPYEGLVPP